MMILRHLFIAFPLLLVALFASGQSKNTEDIILLKNGSLYRGQILEQKEGTIKLLTYARNEIVFSMDEVAEVKYDQLIEGSAKNKEDFVKQKGITNLSQLGLGFGLDNDGYFSATFNFQTAFGYIFSPKIMAGAGVAADIHTSEVVTYPVFALGQYTFYGEQLAPFVRLELGASFYGSSYYTYDKTEPRLMGSLTLGIRKYIAKNTAYYFCLMYRNQGYGYKEDIFNGIREGTYTFNRIFVVYGFQF